MKLKVPYGMMNLGVGESEYIPDDDGMIFVENHDDLSMLFALGCRGPDAVPQPIPSDQPPSQLEALQHYIQQLLAVLVEHGIEAPLPGEPSGAAPEPTGEQEGGASPSDSPPAPDASGDATATLSGAVDFDAVPYAELQTWVKANGVSVPGNMAKADLIAACKARFAELAAAKE